MIKKQRPTINSNTVNRVQTVPASPDALIQETSLIFHFLSSLHDAHFHIRRPQSNSATVINDTVYTVLTCYYPLPNRGFYTPKGTRTFVLICRCCVSLLYLSNSTLEMLFYFEGLIRVLLMSESAW